jgi:hypothetical protein
MINSRIRWARNGTRIWMKRNPDRILVLKPEGKG